MKFTDLICSQMETYLAISESGSSKYTSHSMLKKLSPSERRNAVEIALKRMQEDPASLIVKRKKEGGFPSHRLIIQDKESCLRISFVARKILARGSIKVVKELETIVFNKASSKVSIEDEVIAILKSRYRIDEETRDPLPLDKIDIEIAAATEKEIALYARFDDCPYVQHLRRYQVFTDSFKPRQKAYFHHQRARLGNLEDFLKKVSVAERPSMTYELLVAFTYSSKALQAFHAKGYYHIDFKSENILGLTSDDWVICDLESLYTKREYLTDTGSIPATPFSVPPEFASLDLAKMDPEKHEAWSLGMAILTSFGGNEVFDVLGIDVSDAKCKKSIAALKQADLDRVIGEVTEKYPLKQSPLLRELLLRLLRIEPVERMSIDEASERLEELVKTFR